MPLYRSASSLSFAEPRRPPLLQDWVDRSLSEGLSAARDRAGPVLHVSAKKVDWELPLGAFDSSVTDAFFFGGRNRVVVGVGVSKVLEPGSSRRTDSQTGGNLLGKDALSTVDASKIMVMGGWGFPRARRLNGAGVWRDFPPSRWVVPALTLTSEGGETHFALAVHLRPSSDLAPLRRLYRALLKALELRTTDGPQRSDATTESLPGLQSSRSIPSQQSWLSLAQDAIDSISRDELKKLVLSRAVALTFRGKVVASVVLRRLIALNPDSTVFAIKRRGSVFLGATPESLMSARKGEVEVDCVAASAPRSEDTTTDESLGARLLRDPKSRREHEFVVQAAVRTLTPISSRIEVPDGPVLKKLTTIHHLYTPVRAKLLDGEDVWAAALALWPNPAMGGEPKEKAVGWISKFEKFNRGWYSGVVGLLNARLDEADLVVGIRSGVIKGRQAVIYAGAGLVAGSEPQEEFEETSWKLKTMRRALGIDAAVNLARGG
jgi:menaquinone-specific isochorismate synthase